MLLEATLAATMAWTPLPSATIARTEVAAARVGRSIYVAGGFAPSGRSTRLVERYDIRRRRWSRVRRMPVALNHAVAVEHRGKLYVSGGYTSSTGLAAPSGVLLRYDPRRNRWRSLPSAPTPRAAHAAAVIGRRLYVAGGANDTGSLRSLEFYDFRRKRWRSGPSFPGPARNHTAGVAAGGRFYVLAGRGGPNYAAVDRYDPRRRVWERMPDMGVARGGIASVVLRDGRIVAFGGEELEPDGETIAEVEVFDPRDRGWRRLPDMRTPRHGLGGVALGNRVFAIEGGPSPGLFTSDALEFLDVPPRR